jgi:MFS family permease
MRDDSADELFYCEQVFLGEVAEPSMRGLLSSIPYVSYSMGILMVYALGATLHWQTVAWLAIILPLLSLLSFSLLPESPVWLARNNRVEEAGKALIWLRGSYSGGKMVGIPSTFFTNNLLFISME